jgi:ADP-heptose:LPS heptosyltransferase
MRVDDAMPRPLIIQLARVGDLVQSMPAMTALSAHGRATSMDLLCPAALASIGSCIPVVERVLPWEVERWRLWGDRWESAPKDTLRDIETYLQKAALKPYGVAYNLNQHNASMLAASLFGRRVVGPGDSGPLATALPPWADYLRGVVRDRARNRVHLADVFCGLCGVMPSGTAPRLSLPPMDVPDDLASVGEGEGPWIAVVVGAGDVVRRVPPAVWCEWIKAFLAASSSGHIVLVGSRGERELGRAIQDDLSPLCLGRVWDTTGRTTLIQTAAILSRCHWVLGSDTGPLHMGTAVGARAMGFYFARARVHETGPYGEGHWVWQAQLPAGQDVQGESRMESMGVEHINRWPIAESVRLILEGRCGDAPGWTLWESALDRWGACYLHNGVASMDAAREEVWRRLHRPRHEAHEYV